MIFSTRMVCASLVLVCSALGLAACSSTPAPLSMPSNGVLVLPPGVTYKVGRPYKIAGIWYYPAEDYAYSQKGTASWYGSDFHGKRTANGEIYDMNDLTAAHPTLPLPSIVRVTNLENNRTVILRINDRGPFKRNRIIDVSRRGAQLLGFYEAGTTRVRVEIDSTESLNIKNLALGRNPGAMPRVISAPRTTVDAVELPPHHRLPHPKLCRAAHPGPSRYPLRRTLSGLPRKNCRSKRCRQTFQRADSSFRPARSLRNPMRSG